MNEAVDRLIVERQALDRGFPGGLLISGAAHLALLALAIVGPMLMPKPPLIRIADGFVVTLPPGGGGSPQAPPAPAAPKQEAPPPPEPPKIKREIIKPPEKEKKTGLPMPDAKKVKKPEARPTPARAAGVPGGTGTSSQTSGIELVGIPGPGALGGTDPNGDWYLAAVTNRIFVEWSKQIKTGTFQPLTVRFTILADGTVQDVQILHPSGVYQLDAAAQRAVLVAGANGFGKLPQHYGTDRVTIQAIFKPTS